MKSAYKTLPLLLSRHIPDDRLITDDLRRLAHGTDASFYRLIPELVVQVEREEEVVALLRTAGESRLPVTFRAAGTSLSGQAVSDSILAVLGRTWKNFAIHDNGASISLQPGIIGSRANSLLAPFGRKIGPDPASINAAMIGGIVANNASGMCCGTAQNSYNTLQSMRLIFSDGTLLDTADKSSKGRFLELRRDLVSRITALATRVRSDRALTDRIRGKYKMKNTTGYSLNALVDYDDPIEIIQHLMVGSEGTLGFLAEVTLRTVPDLPHKASALMLFPNIDAACASVELLRSSAPVDAVELMDRASLRSVETKEGMPAYLKDLDAQVASLLVETRSENAASLKSNISRIHETLRSVSTVLPISFTDDPAEFGRLWNIRKGLFPAVGAMRQTGTTVIIEDVAFAVPALARATLDLQKLFKKHGYEDAIIFGHARDGNLHFVFKQDFNSAPEVDRYKRFMDDLTTMVVKQYDGSLKAEHGTGRNISPFVELEWGTEAYGLMKEIKAIFDPDNILNPGVILNPDPLAHLRNLKPLPPADPIVDKCIECGFCETHCPSKDLTLTPRQRIAVFREMKRLEMTREDNGRLGRIRRDYDYYGDQTCATDGLCALACPVNINTGELVKEIRSKEHGTLATRLAGFIAGHMALTTSGARFFLNLLFVVRQVLGTRVMEVLAGAVHGLTGGILPLWNREMPRGAHRLPTQSAGEHGKPKVVYFPTCINRTFGSAPDSPEPSLVAVVPRLLRKAGFEVIIPANADALCCGMAFSSKGFKQAGKTKSRELEQALTAASENGRYPIVVDMSPCLLRMKETFGPALKIYDQIEFALEFLVDRLPIRKLPEPVVIHATCSAIKMGINGKLVELAKKCADSVIVPVEIECCGWAGDRGFTVPELNQSALAELRSQIPENCRKGYSTSRTCEIGLSLHGGVNYQSIFYLIDQCSGRGS